MVDLNQKKTIFSGTQPSGVPTIANYLGAFKNWKNMQDEYNCLFCVVDMHALTIRNKPAELRNRAKSLYALYIALGLDPEKSIIYYQSHVPEHAQLTWILNCYAYIGELSRMTQFKDKSKKHEDNINAGLFTYPVLMAADILLFQADAVPVGDDQRQHIEITRDVAQRFNNLYGDTFTIPEAIVGQVGARIMGLTDATKKMSKSETGNDSVFMLDEPNIILSKFKKAVTDSNEGVYFDKENKPGISNLLDIYSAVTNQSIEKCMQEFDGKGYGDFKKAVGEAVAAELEPVQKKYKELMADKEYLSESARKGAERAREIASKTYRKAAKKVGLAQL